jgi:hypothetical protein
VELGVPSFVGQQVTDDERRRDVDLSERSDEYGRLIDDWIRGRYRRVAAG